MGKVQYLERFVEHIATVAHADRSCSIFQHTETVDRDDSDVGEESDGIYRP